MTLVLVSNKSVVRKCCSSPEPYDIVTVGAKSFRHADNEIRLAGPEGLGRMQLAIKPEKLVLFLQVGHSVTVPASGRLCNLGCATGPHSLFILFSFTNQVLVQHDLT